MFCIQNTFEIYLACRRAFDWCRHVAGASAYLACCAPFEPSLGATPYLACEPSPYLACCAPFEPSLGACLPETLAFGSDTPAAAAAAAAVAGGGGTVAVAAAECVCVCVKTRCGCS